MIVVILGFCFNCFPLIYFTAFLPNVGLPFWYYAEYNDLKANIHKIKGAKITDELVNYDSTIEEIAFDIDYTNGYRASIFFPGCDCWRGDVPGKITGISTERMPVRPIPIDEINEILSTNIKDLEDVLQELDKFYEHWNTLEEISRSKPSSECKGGLICFDGIEKLVGTEWVSIKRAPYARDVR